MTARWSFIGHPLRDDLPERWPERIPIREIDEPHSYVERARTAEQVPVPRCRCGGLRSNHGTDKRGRPTCFHSATCGCAEWRPVPTAIPARLDERHDPSPEPIDRSIQ